ncbi:MAG: LacI family transcriptional regulator [Anaerolineaceae bacterium]|nr:LacI family transcriptional regulator [Anaerolineaceae bacterium]
MSKKRVTSQDVANLAGVSRTTVSFILNDDKRFSFTPQTRQKVLNAAETLDYVPNASAQALATSRAKAIGLIMTRSPQYISSDTFLPQIIGGLLDVVKQYKLGLLIEWVQPGQQLRIYRELVHAKHIDGMILLTPRLDDEGLRELEDFDIPAVLMGDLPESTLYSVDIDNRLAAESAVNYLLGLGHTSIACITNAPLSFSSANDRLQGYKDALLKAGIKPNEKLVRYADFDPNSGYKSVKSLLANQVPFTAAFIASDNIVIGAKSALIEAGLRIPEDVSIVGFDNIPWAKYSDPPLTTVHMPAEKLAQSACFMLMDLMQGKDPKTKHLRLDSELIIRQSCRKI